MLPPTRPHHHAARAAGSPLTSADALLRERSSQLQPSRLAAARAVRNCVDVKVEIGMSLSVLHDLAAVDIVKGIAQGPRCA